MAYADVDIAFRSLRADGDRRGKIEAAMLKKAVTRLGAILSTEDQREYLIARMVVDGGMPDAWVKLVLGMLDIAGQLALPTDLQIDTQVNAAWLKLTTARS